MAFIEIDFFSNVLGRGVSCSVILPQTAERLIGMEATKKDNALPVLWLLHGMSDDHTTWIRRTSIERYVAPLGLAVIMPNAELSSYANMAHGGNFYDFIVEELPDVMGGFFNLSTRREDNFIAGLSMGGAGSLKIGLANPEKYAAIGCLSAGAINHPHPKDTGSIRYEENWRDFLLYDGATIAGTEEDVFESARKIIKEGLPAPRIYHTIGRSDELLDAARETRDFFRSYEGNPFDYVYTEDEGVHNWEYWDNHIVEFLRFIQK